MSTATTTEVESLSPRSCMQYLEDIHNGNVNNDDLVKADTELALELAKMAVSDITRRTNANTSSSTTTKTTSTAASRRKSTIDVLKLQTLLPKDASIDDYVHKLGDDEFRRTWMRSLRMLKKASKHCHGRDKNLTFHQKVYQDCCDRDAIWFQFFLNNQMDYKKSGHKPHFDTAEQAIIVLSTLADSKSWAENVSNGYGPTVMNDEVKDILRLARRFLRRLQYFTDTYGGPTQQRRTNMVAHTLLKQICILYSNARLDEMSEDAVDAFRDCVELEIQHLVPGGEVLSWIPGRQRWTVNKLRDVADEKIWKWIGQYSRKRMLRRW